MDAGAAICPGGNYVGSAQFQESPAPARYNAGGGGFALSTSGAPPWKGMYLGS